MGEFVRDNFPWLFAVTLFGCAAIKIYLYYHRTGLKYREAIAEFEDGGEMWMLGKARTEESLTIEEDGLTVVHPEEEEGGWTMRWDEVEEIRTYKWDHWACDEICVAFRVSEGWYELSEENDEFNAVMKIVEERFPGVPDDWWSEVAFPPMETNMRTLWKRAQEGETSE